jgi:hypothetical protein
MKAFLELLKGYRHLINKQQLKTLRGQALAGDVEGARKGLQKILSRKMSKRDMFINAHRGARYMKDADYRAQFALNLKHIYSHTKQNARYAKE